MSPQTHRSVLRLLRLPDWPGWLYTCLLVLALISAASPAQEAPDTTTATKQQEIPVEASPEPDTSVNADIQLTIAGSVTMEPLLRAWAKALLQRYPSLRISITANGSNNAPLALAEGTANIGAMSRRMSGIENNLIQQRQGSMPNEYLVALDTIAIVVHPDNPLDSISLQQLDQLFSASHRCSDISPGQIPNIWRDIFEHSPDTRHLTAIAPTIAAREIQLMGRFSNSGTYRWFREHALCNGIYRNTLQAFPSHGGIIRALQHSPSAIAYVGSAYVTAGVKSLLVTNEQSAVKTGADNQQTEQPLDSLARPLFLYSIGNTDTSSDGKTGSIGQLIDLIYSTRGQNITRQAGFTVPQTIPTAQQSLPESP